MRTALMATLLAATAAHAAVGVYPRVEVRFQVPVLLGNPFDFTENDVVVSFREPGGAMKKVPAFFDGGATWKARFSPTKQGKHRVGAVTINGREARPQGLSPSSFQVKGKPAPGFVRRDPKDARRFALDDGAPYYPIGQNVAWDSPPDATVLNILPRMGQAGENWARVWMCHWDLKNLDWVENRSTPYGTLDLEVARRWDAIVEAAERSGVRLQVVLQHHGQYSTGADANWDINPWSTARGGFLATPEDFFTSPKAAALTRAKYRYIIARWGYSPAVMAWELFNEVQWTDAARKGRGSTVAAWHDEMARFIRAQDPYKHLVTSSMGVERALLGNGLDFWQPHVYAPDPVGIARRADGLGQDRPVFLGEFGSSGAAPGGDEAFLRRAVWASLMTDAAGAAQFWPWEVVHRQDLYRVYRSATAYAVWSGLPAASGVTRLDAQASTTERGPLTFAPGAGWEKAATTEFEVRPSGEVTGVTGMPQYLQGDANRTLFPRASFSVEYPAAGTFSVEITRVARLGAKVVLSLDGAPIETRDFPPAAADTDVKETLRLAVPAGRHTLLLDNPGADWVVLGRITLEPYASRIGVMGKRAGETAWLWLHSRAPDAGTVSGTLDVRGLRPGRYSLRWWDIEAGRASDQINVKVGADGVLSSSTPSFTRDAAAVIRRAAR